jgi:hypothetical protein
MTFLLLWNSEFRDCVHRSLLLDPALGHLAVGHIFMYCFSGVCSDNVASYLFVPRSPKWSIPPVFSSQKYQLRFIPYFSVISCNILLLPISESFKWSLPPSPTLKIFNHNSVFTSCNHQVCSKSCCLGLELITLTRIEMNPAN